MQLVSMYNYDPTARAAANKVVNESITVTPPTQITDYSYVVPRAAPFYAETLIVKDGTSVGAKTLVENVDYWCVIDFVSASISLNKRVAVGIALIDPSYSGTLYISYQALGGNYTLADYSILEELISKRYVVRHVAYEQIINLPNGFAPAWHQHEVADMVGMSQVVNTLGGVKTAIEGRQGSFSQLSTQLASHTNATTGAHTPGQVGLGRLMNYGVASLADVTLGAADKYVTAATLKQFVTGQGIDTSGFLLSSTANSTYVKIITLNQYSTTAVSDGRYASKTDTYTKAEVNNLIGTGGGGSNTDGYTKLQADAKFSTKSDLDLYLKIDVADGRYVGIASLNNYQTTLQSDTKYAFKSDTYTKAQSDIRYFAASSISAYLTVIDAAATYQTKTAMTSYYTKAQVNASKLTTGTFVTNGAEEYTLTLTEKLADESESKVNIAVKLPNHPSKETVYTKTQVESLLEELRSNIAGVTRTEFSVAVPLGGSSGSITFRWTITKVGLNFHFACFNTTPFYYNETSYYFSTDGTNAKIWDHKIQPTMFNCEIKSLNNSFNATARFADHEVRMNPATGDILWGAYINHDQNNNNTYVGADCFYAGFTITALGDTEYNALSKLMLRGSNITYVPPNTQILP